MSFQEFIVRGVVYRNTDVEHVLRCLEYLVPRAGNAGAFIEYERRYSIRAASGATTSRGEIKPEIVLRFDINGISAHRETIAHLDLYNQTTQRMESAVAVRFFDRLEIQALDAERFMEIFISNAALAFEWVRRGHRFQFRDGVIADVFRLERPFSDPGGRYCSEPQPDFKYIVELRHTRAWGPHGRDVVKNLPSSHTENLLKKLAALAPYVVPAPKHSENLQKNWHG
jgi:hypothetical protein